MAAPFDEILDQIAEVAPGLHTAGTFRPRTLEAIARAAQKLHISHSAETGSGASTLLFSHLSGQHTVFAKDDGSGSVANVQKSPLLRPGVVNFVEGPTQITLPQHRFEQKLQLVLIDGPHAYPFPDLEYYYLYPHLEPGALLIVDDIHIPTVHNLFRFLRRDAMFSLDRVVQTTAFFTRTSAPAFDPLGDGWWLQGYNAKTLRRYGWPHPIRRIDPRSRTRGCPVEILSPQEGARVGEAGIVEGSGSLPPDSHLWILARRKDDSRWWPQGGGAAHVANHRWEVPITYGGPSDSDYEFDIAAIVIGPATHQQWTACYGQSVALPPPQFIRGEAYRGVTKARKP